MIRFLRTASPKALALSAAVATALLVAAPMIATGAGTNGARPAAKPLSQALADASAPKSFEGVSARIAFSNRLLDSVDMGEGASPLLGSGTGRLWGSADGKVRVELQSSSGGGDVQLVADGKQAWITMGDGSTVYRATWTGKPDAAYKSKAEKHTPLTVKSIETAIKSVAGDVKLSEPVPDNIAGQPAYTVTATPVDTSGLLAGARISWASANGAPLAISILAKDQSQPALELRATEATFGPVDNSVFDIQPPAGAKITDVDVNDLAAKAKTEAAKAKAAGSKTPKRAITGLPAVTAAASFKVNAPASLAGRARSELVLLGKGKDAAVAVTYGTGMSAIALIERPAEAKKAPATDSSYQLPTTKIGAITATEIGTVLGAVAEFSLDGVDYTVIGSVPVSAIESAVAGL